MISSHYQSFVSSPELSAYFRILCSDHFSGILKPVCPVENVVAGLKKHLMRCSIIKCTYLLKIFFIMIGVSQNCRLVKVESQAVCDNTNINLMIKKETMPHKKLIKPDQVSSGSLPPLLSFLNPWDTRRMALEQHL